MMHVRSFLCAAALALPAICLAVGGQAPAGDVIPTAQGDAVIRPLEHGTLTLTWNGKTVYVDPVGGARRFASLPAPDLILVTDIHGDHLNVDTLKGVVRKTTTVVVPAAVAKQLPRSLRKRAIVLSNGMMLLTQGMEVQAVPMYNLTGERLKFHDKGRGNGYVIGLGGRRFYISGDTEDIPEMRALRDIDVAVVCMNLPYTMTVEQAADAVREFRPRIVYPYHYRGTGGLSDVARFQRLVEQTEGIEVRLRDWYPQQ